MSQNGKTCAILAYLLVGIIWYFADEKMKKDTFAKFHVKQGLFLLIAGVVISIGVMIISTILAFIPFIGWIISVLLGIGVNIALLILWIFGLINAINGKKEKVPVIGGYAEKVLTF
ncbi:MAG: DUF4870 domain-containing protein [Nanobdellota archaeon]